MKYMRKIMNNEKGFTLIEIIAVLVILGILAAVAIPKYMSLQTQAQMNAIQGAIAAGTSTLTLAYSQCLLQQTTPSGGVSSQICTPPSGAAVSAPTVLGDFTVAYSGTWPSATVTVQAGPAWFVQANYPAASYTKTIVMQ